MPHPRLLELRQQIDALDSQLQELLIQRTALTQQVGELKRSTPSFINRGQFMYPGREAMILRRLVERHRGAMPVQALMQLWREIMMATLSVVEQPFSCGYLGGGALGIEGGADYGMLARDHFGVCVPMTAFDNPANLIQAVQQQRLDYAVLPWPSQRDVGQWWTALLQSPMGAAEAAGQKALRVFFALPFYPSLTATTTNRLPQAAVVGALPYDDLTDLDDSLVAIAIPQTLSRDAFLSRLQGVTPSPQCLAQAQDIQQPSQQWLCLQLAGAFVPGGQLWQELETALQGVAWAIRPLGLYPRPFDTIQSHSL